MGRQIICPSCGADFDIQKEIEKDLLKMVAEKEVEIKKQFSFEKERELKKIEGTLKESIRENVLNEFSKKDQERELLISHLRREVVSLKTKIEQGSQQLQGEVQELDLEHFLKTNFLTDEVLPVPKGITGGDVIHHVKSVQGKDLGTILWESKKTKAFGSDWTTKLKKDMREINATFGIIVTEIMPNKSTEKILFHEGVLIIHPTMVQGVTTLLRKNLQDITRAKRFSEGSKEKAELLYDYLTGHQFRLRLESIIDSFQRMKDDLEKEKRVYLKNFKVREKELEQLMENTVEMCGEIQGTIGGRDFHIPSLELQEESDA